MKSPVFYQEQIEQQQQEGEPAPPVAPAPQPTVATTPAPAVPVPAPAVVPPPDTPQPKAEVIDVRDGLFGTDGKLTDAWKADPRFKDLDMTKFVGKTGAEIALAYTNLEKVRGGVTTVPAVFEKADPAVATFRTANGIPDDPAAYAFKPDPALLREYGVAEGDWDVAQVMPYAEELNRVGLTPAQAEAVIRFGQKQELENMRRAADVEKNNVAALTEDLRREFGSDYHHRMEATHRMLTDKGIDHDDPVFNHPAVIKAFDRLRQEFREDATPGNRIVKNSSGKYATNADEARAIQTDKNHPDYAEYQKGNKDVAAKVRRLLAGQKAGG